MIRFPQDINQQISGLKCRIKAFPTDYALLSDEYLIQLSAFYVSLKTGLGSFPELYQEIQTTGDKPFCAIYAELVRRILDRENRDRTTLVHALYGQFAYAPYHAYGKYGDLEWVSNLIFDTIDNRIADGAYGISVLDLILDACALLEEFEPAYQACIERALAQWDMERKKDAWLSLPVAEVAHRLRIMTNYNDSLIANLEASVSQSKQLLKTFSSRILDEADASTLIVYREALRNTYYFGAVSTKYFSELEHRSDNQAENTLSRDLLQAMLMVDRLERELMDKVCCMAQLSNEPLLVGYNCR